MKAIFVSFNQAYYEMILNVMDRNNIRGFTYWNEVQGRGSKTDEPHYGSHAWPTLNSAILAISGDTSSDGSEDGSARITCFCLEHRKNNLIT